MRNFRTSRLLRGSLAYQVPTGNHYRARNADMSEADGWRGPATEEEGRAPTLAAFLDSRQGASFYVLRSEEYLYRKVGPALPPTPSRRMVGPDDRELP